MSDKNNLLDVPSVATPKEGNNQVQESKGEVIGDIEGALNAYEGFTKVQIEVNGESKEVYLENETLKVDSSNWKETTINGVPVKINPEGDITEYLDGAEAGEQLFTWDAAMREARVQGKRLPYTDDYNENSEFQAIVEKVGVEEFMKLFPGSREKGGGKFCYRGDYASFWTASHIGNDAEDMNFEKGDSDVCRDWSLKAYGLSARCIKD